MLFTVAYNIDDHADNVSDDGIDDNDGVAVAVKSW